MFFETPRFPESVSVGMEFGPSFRTNVVRVKSGHETRNQGWSDPLYGGDAAYGVRNQTQLDELYTYFLIAEAMTHEFRFKNWLDYVVTTANGRLGTGAVGTGFPTYKLYRRYSNAAGFKDRRIFKPVPSANTIYRNAAPVTFGGGAGQVAIDTATGIATFVADVTLNISAITQANPGKVTTIAPHGYSTGNLIYFAGIGGMTQLNGQVGTITVVDDDEFTIGINTTGYGAYTSGGTAAKYPQPADALTWAGEHDFPCRFDTDDMRPRLDDFDIYSWGPIPIIEIRIEE